MYLLWNLVAGIAAGLVPAVVLCALAGRWDLWNVWVTVAILLVSTTLQTLALYRKSPDLLKERGRLGTGGRVRWTSARAYLALIGPQWIIAGLDHRFHWSDNLPLAVVVAGLVIFTIAEGLATWSALVNPFLSPEIRIQADRGQWVIHTGPYAIMRHPFYASVLLSMVAAGLALDSLLSIIPALAYAAVTFQVTAIEDRMLQAELAGYADYAAKVRYRLVPGVW